MKPTAPLARALVKQTVHLRGQALTDRAVTPRELATVWPQNLSMAPFPIREAVAVNRLLRCALAGSAFGVLDARAKLLDEALSDAPVAVPGTTFHAHPKAYLTLVMLEHVSLWAIRDVLGAQGHREELSGLVSHVRAWSAIHEGPGLPFRDVKELDPVPSWLADLPVDDVERAYQTANGARCERLLGDQMRLAALSTPHYVPQALKELALVSEIDSEILSTNYSYAWCLALAEIATDLKGA